MAKLFTTIGEVRAVIEDGRSAGFIRIGLRGRQLHVDALILDLELRGHGLGRAAFRRLCDESAGRAEVIELGLREGNQSVSGFYHPLGFATSRGRRLPAS